jgi:hypothetical protein
MNASMARRRALLTGIDSAPRVAEPKPTVAEIPAPKPKSEEIDAASGAGPVRKARGHERPYAARIECPCCERMLEAQSSILHSVRCDGCGELLSFDEVIALRVAEHTRTRQYV